MAKVHINKALQLNPQEPMALKGKQFLDQVSKKRWSFVWRHVWREEKINGLSTARWGEDCPWMWSKTWIEDRLQQVFHRWGYHRIITNSVRYADGCGAIQQSTVIQLQNAEEELGLRPELTARSLARL